MNIPEPTSPDELTIDDWRGAFNALTELYNEEVERTRAAESHIDTMRASFIDAVESVMKLYADAATARLAQLQDEVLALTAERDRLRLIVAVNGDASAQGETPRRGRRAKREAA